MLTLRVKCIKMNKKTLGWILLGGGVIFLLYMWMKKRQTAGCYMFEEVHEHGNGETTWVSIIKQDESGNSLRPPSDWKQIGDSFEIKNTEAALNGTYNIVSIWYDENGNIGSLRVTTPPEYVFDYGYQQGGNQRDATYYGIGSIC